MKTLLLLLFSFCSSQPMFNHKETVTFPQENPNEETTKLSNSDIGPCPCDYTPYICDYRCCCDTTCPETARNSWFDSNECLNNTLEAQSSEVYCIDDKYVYSFNRKKGMTEFRDSLTGLLCVSYDSNADGNSFEPIPKYLGDESKKQFYKLFLDDTKLQSYAYVTDKNYPTPTGLNYKTDDPIQQIRLQSNILSDNKFYLKAPGAFGECVAGPYVKFMQDIPAVKCGHTFVNM